jgi:uncharacterized repeat protein (TIGR03806 family)
MSVMILTSCYNDNGSVNAPTSGLSERVTNTTCLAGNTPLSTSGVKLTEVYNGLSTTFPLSQRNSLVQKPGSSNEDWYLGTITGEVYKFSKSGDGTDYMSVLDIKDRVADGADPEPYTLNEGGMLSIAFHPDFSANGYLYVFYTGFPQADSPADVRFVSHLSRFTSTDNGVTFDPDTEKEILKLNQYSINHKGSTINFGPDGFLYISIGEDNSADSSQLQTNRTDALDPFSWLGSILRIDVDAGDPYTIPVDNPYADGTSGAPEVFAKGLRNPYRWSFDRELGDIYLGDVGSTEFEEINIITKGSSYGWPEREGYGCFLPRYPDGTGCLSDGLTDPVIAYDHTEGISILGGFVYRGTSIPSLFGRYLFGDSFFQKIWQLRYNDQGVGYKEELITLPQEAGAWGFLSFAEDNDGEIYIVSNRSIYKLEADTTAGSVVTISTKLSETGCFDESNPTLAKDALIPYDVITPLWTDGAAKKRWFALPDNEKVTVNSDGTFAFPPGSVLVKNFILNDKLVETRLLMHHTDGGWGGYSYEWNAEQTEAFLLSEGKTKFVEGQNYTYPSRTQCFQCHNTAANTTIGPETLQLNKEVVYEKTGITANQLMTLESIGVFTENLPAEIEDISVLPDAADSNESLENRFMGYVHANCAYCHQPLGSGRGNFDLTYKADKTLSEYNLCNVTPSISNLGIMDAKLVAPGMPELSVLSLRLDTNGVDKMPPVGRNYIDTAHVDMIKQFITSLSTCP